MKYIRTKDGIEKLDVDREHLAEYMNGKKADTIEELCDYVFYNDEYDLQITKCPIYFKENFIDLLKAKRIWNVKFAILSDKGLIYVAKMNEKGELELC